jgi:hypothetical protein
MFKRTTPTLIAVAALAVAGAGPGAQAASAGGVSYVGQTSQGEPLSMKMNAKRNRLRMLYVDWSAGAPRCSDHREYMSSTMLGMWGNPPPRVRAGRFESRVEEGFENERGGFTVEQLSLSGRVKGLRASGSLRVQVTVRNARGSIVNRCDTGRISWNAVD